MLSNHSDTFDADALKGTTLDSRELKVSVDSNEFDVRRRLGHLTCENKLEQEEGSFGRGTAQWVRGGVHLELSHPPELRIPHDQSAPATRSFIESSAMVDGWSKPERLFHTPSIVVSDSANDEVADGGQGNLSESCSSTPSHKSLESIQRTAVQPSCMFMDSFLPDTRPRSLNGSLPTNYELATQDRQPPDVPAEIECQSESSASDSLRDFCNDADSTMTDDAAAHYTATNSSHAKRRRLSREYPGFQIANRIRSSKQRLLANPPNPSAAWVSTYLTPTLSFENLSTYQRSDGVCSREMTPSIQSVLSCNDPNEPLSPASLSSSSSLKTDNSVTRCLECPNVSFEGPNRKNSLQRHQRDHHSGRSRLECPALECTVTFAPGRKDNRLKHIRDKHPDFPLPSSTTKRKRKPGSE